MNVAEMRALIRAHYRDPAGTSRSDAEWLEIMNGVYLDFCDEVPLVEATSTLTLAAGATTATLPADLVSAFPPALYRNGVQLRRVARRNLPLPSVGTPSRWAILGGNAVFDAAPATAIDFDLVGPRSPAPLALDADVPAFPADFHRLIPYRSLGRAFFADRQADIGAYWEGEALKIERRARRALNDRHMARRGREDESV